MQRPRKTTERLCSIWAETRREIHSKRCTKKTSLTEHVEAVCVFSQIQRLDLVSRYSKHIRSHSKIANLDDSNIASPVTVIPGNLDVQRVSLTHRTLRMIINDNLLIYGYLLNLLSASGTLSKLETPKHKPS